MQNHTVLTCCVHAAAGFASRKCEARKAPDLRIGAWMHVSKAGTWTACGASNMRHTTMNMNIKLSTLTWRATKYLPSHDVFPRHGGGNLESLPVFFCRSRYAMLIRRDIVGFALSQRQEITSQQLCSKRLSEGSRTLEPITANGR